MRHAPSLKLVALVFSAYACALWLLIAPRPVVGRADWALPVAESGARDACEAPDALVAVAVELRDALREGNEAEVAASEPEAVSQGRVRALAALRVRAGADVVAVVRRAAVCDLNRALAGTLPERERARVLGLFLDELAYERVIDDTGSLRLPVDLVRTLYGVRMNVQLGAPLTEGLSGGERALYYAAVALHMPGATAERRLWAASAYAAEAYPHAAEVMAQVLLASAPTHEALPLFAAIYAKTSALRARNTAFGLSRAE